MLAALLIAGGALLGCESGPDPKEFGEIITEVPRELDKPFPLPQLDEPQDKAKDASK
jgi:hypothetical protein